MGVLQEPGHHWWPKWSCGCWQVGQKMASVEGGQALWVPLSPALLWTTSFHFLPPEAASAPHVPLFALRGGDTVGVIALHLVLRGWTPGGVGPGDLSFAGVGPWLHPRGSWATAFLCIFLPQPCSSSLPASVSFSLSCPLFSPLQDFFICFKGRKRESSILWSPHPTLEAAAGAES